MRIKKYKNHDRTFKCQECCYEYKEKKWAERCEAWCKKYKSCNDDITKHAVKNRGLNEKSNN